jgi:hypothetical protein
VTQDQIRAPVAIHIYKADITQPSGNPVGIIQNYFVSSLSSVERVL